MGSFPVYSYSLFVVLAYLAGLGYALLEAKRLRQEPVHVIDLSLWFFLAAILGARVLFIIVAYDRFMAHPLEMLKLWKGGLVYYGGLFAAVLAGLAYLKRHGLPLGFWSDLFAPVAMLVLTVGRIGCFLNGCCYGKIAPDLPWGVTYPVSHSFLGPAQYPVHPTPIYESLATLIIFIFLVWLSRRKRFQGEVFWSMLLAYAAARFVIEYFRGDPRGTVDVLMLSTSQAISLVAAAASIFMLVWSSRRAPGPETGARDDRSEEEGGPE